MNLRFFIPTFSEIVVLLDRNVDWSLLSAQLKIEKNINIRLQPSDRQWTKIYQDKLNSFYECIKDQSSDITLSVNDLAFYVEVDHLPIVAGCTNFIQAKKNLGANINLLFHISLRWKCKTLFRLPVHWFCACSVVV